MIYEHIISYHGQLSISWGGSAHFDLIMPNSCRTRAEPCAEPCFFMFFQHQMDNMPKEVWYMNISYDIMAKFQYHGGVRHILNHQCVNDTPAPGKKLFLDLRPEKRHVGWKNNPKQFLRWCCYPYFCSFGRKSRFCSQLPRCEVVICGETNEN